MFESRSRQLTFVFPSKMADCFECSPTCSGCISLPLTSCHVHVDTAHLLAQSFDLRICSFLLVGLFHL